MAELILETLLHIFCVSVWAIMTVMLDIGVLQIICIVNVILWAMIMGLDIIRFAIKIIDKKKLNNNKEE